MAKLSLDLTQFKSAGVYTLEYDDTTSAVTVESNSLRLLVGFNGKGPFNRPVFLANDDDRAKIFGDIDTKLERKGDYFNRFAQTMVPSSPIFALNLLSTNDSYDGPDQVNYAALSLNAGAPNPAVTSINALQYGEADKSAADKTIYGSAFSNNIPFVGNAPYASFYDRSRFWIPSEDNVTAVAAMGLNDATETAVFNSANFFNIANVGTEELSVLIFKPESLRGYDVTAADWYNGAQNIPYGFIRPNDYISDYFIQVVIVKGNWSDAKSLSTSTLWKDYFNTKGILKSKINSFLSATGISVLGSYIGSIIPEFTDKAGNNQDIVTKINDHTSVSGILAAFNKDAAHSLAYDYDSGKWFQDIDGDGNYDADSDYNEAPYIIDMIGHEFAGGYSVPAGDDASLNPVDVSRYGINFLSYNYDASNTDGILSTISFASYFSDTKAVNENQKNIFVVANDSVAANLGVGDFVKNDAADSSTLIPGITRITNKVSVDITDLSDADKAAIDGGTYTSYKVTDASFSYNNAKYAYSGYVIVNNAIKKQYFWVYTTIEDVALIDASNSALSIKDYTPSSAIVINDIRKDVSIDFTVTQDDKTYDINLYFDSDEDNINSNADTPDSGVIEELKTTVQFSIEDGSANGSDGTTVYYIKDADDNVYLVDGMTNYTVDFSDITFDGNIYIDASTSKVAGGDAADYGITATISKLSLTIETGGTATKQLPISDGTISGALRFIPLKGLAIQKRHMPGYDASGNLDPEAGVEKIYSLLMNDKGINRGLCNPDMIDFRYLIDSFGYGLGADMGGKVYLSQLAAKRNSCTAIINAPSKRQFASSSNPYFCDTFNEGLEVKPAFDTSYIATGGNGELYHTKTFSLPDEDNGATYAAVFWPWLTYTQNGKSFNVPPAADVANVFIRKFNGSDPYMICANRTGILNNTYLTGTEYSVDTEDRNYLEPMGINAIISQDNNIMIYGNQTAYQTVDSDLNKLHVRENLNTIELRCKDVLKSYVFTYNTATTRGEIVANLTPILAAMVTSGAISSYTIQCDTDNNTQDIIDANYGIVDIQVEFNHGMEKIVTRVTITRNSVTIS